MDFLFRLINVEQSGTQWDLQHPPRILFVHLKNNRMAAAWFCMPFLTWPAALLAYFRCSRTAVFTSASFGPEQLRQICQSCKSKSSGIRAQSLCYSNRGSAICPCSLTFRTQSRQLCDAVVLPDDPKTAANMSVSEKCTV
jgi:hypothetical protein